MSTLRRLLVGISHRAGIDRAIGLTVLGRILQGTGSVGTVLMIVHILTPVEQGFYYALWSLVALQSVFELGFSFVILQVAAHERARLTIPTNSIVSGDPLAHARLASILQRAVRWYAVAASVLFLALVAGGSYFFSSHDQGAHAGMWQTPLRLTALACSLTFFIGPILSFLEGCGQVTSVAKMRLMQSIFSITAAWAVMLSHHGLYAPSMVLFGQAIVAAIFLHSRHHLLIPLLRLKVPTNCLNWRADIWPFQWKIAISWLCDYFIFQLPTPVLFALRGPVEAGRMGVSMSIVMQLSGVMVIWMTTKAAPFGTMVARKERPQLDSIFFRTLWQSLGLFVAGAVVVLAGAVTIDHALPRFGTRFVEWPVFLLLLITALSAHVVQCEALYLRAHKSEPFLIQSIVMAIATAASVMMVARSWGTMGVAFAFFCTMGVGGLLSATVIFNAKRRQWSEEWKTVAPPDYSINLANERI